MENEAANDSMNNPWTVEKEAFLITLWRRQPALWQNDHPDSKRKSCRDAITDSFVAQLGAGFTRDLVVKKMKNLRTYFFADDKKMERLQKAHGRSLHSQWVHADSLQFLRESKSGDGGQSMTGIAIDEHEPDDLEGLEGDVKPDLNAFIVSGEVNDDSSLPLGWTVSPGSHCSSPSMVADQAPVQLQSKRCTPILSAHRAKKFRKEFAGQEIARPSTSQADCGADAAYDEEDELFVKQVAACLKGMPDKYTKELLKLEMHQLMFRFKFGGQPH